MTFNLFQHTIQQASLRGKLLLAGLSLLSLPAFAQQTLTLNQPNMTGDYRAGQSITLAPGFSSTGPFRAYISNGPLNVSFAGLPSSNQNYINTRIFKKPDVNAGNLNSPRNISEVNQTVQYFDGLGRPMQTVQTQGSPSGKDLVQPVAYDAFGREVVKYQPYAAPTADGSYKSSALSEQLTFYANPGGGIQPTAYPFSQTVFESSPLNRVQQQGFPGATWQPYNAGISNSGHTVKSDYGTNVATEVQLWVVNGSGASSAGSYGAGKLYKTVSKDENWTSNKSGITAEFKDLEGRVVLKRTWASESDSLSTYYVYDDLGNLRYVLPPGANTSSFTESDAVFDSYIYGYHYDGRRRLTEKKIPGKGWEYMVYNQLDQLVLSQDANQRTGSQWLYTKYDAMGRVVQSGIYSDGSSRDNLQTTVSGQSALWEQRSGAAYSNDAFPQNNTSLRLVNYYDDYGFSGASGLPASGISPSNKTKSLATGSLVYQTDGTSPKLSVLYYDEEGRVLQIVSENHLNGTDRVTNSWNFAGELAASTRTHTHPTNGTTTVATRYEYDHMGRKLNSFESINGQTEVQLSSNIYNEIGQLKEKQLHNGQQTTSYVYNERGWLKSSTSPQFSQSLNYQDSGTPQYNGNIASQNWGAGNSLSNTFTYQYDKLNRLTSGSSASMSEALTYDVMGNISSLNRNGAGSSTYYYNGNRLSYASGASVNTQTYQYDGNGNAKYDGRNGTYIDYNYLNLPQSVSKSGLSIIYTYDAAGNKLKKQSNTGGTTDYIGGIQYQNGTIDFIQTEEGIARNNSGTYSYEYTLTDHLGNNRATFYRNPSTGAIEVLQKDDYYPFGKRNIVTAGANKYLYNKKELQDELGQYDYGARFYDPEIGRWNVVDPLAENYFSSTPFSYVLNRPLNAIDPDGRYFFGLFGSTSEQRKAAREFGNENNGEVKNIGSRKNIRVDYTTTSNGVEGYSIEGRSQSFAEIGPSKVQGQLNNYLAMHSETKVGAQDPVTGQVKGSGRIDQDYTAESLVIGGIALRPVGSAAKLLTERLGAIETGANLSTNGVKLAKQLASEAQMSEKGLTIIGPGKLNEAKRLAQQYGGNVVDWVKKSSSSFTKNGVTFETHWYENISIGVRTEFKTKFP